MPPISVLMAVYNAEAYLNKAIDSILNQTFKDFEFIIINDGSTDASAEILASYQDERIISLHNEQNIGLSASLNQGLHVARGEYLARMDADDISMPERLDKQVAYMEKHPELGVLGTGIDHIDHTGQHISQQINPAQHNEIVWTFLFGNPLVHPTVMMRRELILEAGGYRLKGPAQDRELWLRLLGKTRFANLDACLLAYRTHSSSVTAHRRASRRAREKQFDETDILLKQQFIQQLLARPIAKELVEALTASQRPKTGLLEGLDNPTIEVLIQLLIDCYQGLTESSLIDGDTSGIRQDLSQRICRLSRYSPQCITPHELTRSWRSPIKRRLLVLTKQILNRFNQWPQAWN